MLTALELGDLLFAAIILFETFVLDTMLSVRMGENSQLISSLYQL